VSPAATVEREAAFSSAQARLRALTGTSLAEYRQRVAQELGNAARVAAVYGSSFASGASTEQAATVCQMAASLIGCRHSQVTLLTADEQVHVIAWHAPNVTSASEPIEAHEGYCQNMLPTGEPLAISDARDHPLVCDTRLAREGVIVSYLGVPITGAGGRIIGALCVWDAKERDWNAADVETLDRLAHVLTRAEKAHAAELARS
jgi:GAF domain-containing protein